MKLISYESTAGPRVAALREDHACVDLQQADSSLPATMRELLALDQPWLERAEQAAANSQPLETGNMHLLAPVPNPRKVICVGLNYADHAKESGVDPPPEPVVFNKFPTAICAAGDPIRLPPTSTRVDYEAELVVVIGRGGRNIPASGAFTHIAGYCCGHDVSARDWQLDKPGRQWLLGKSFDTFAPVGPHLVTADEIDDPGQLDIALRLNGTTMQQSNTRQLIFDIPTLIEYISSVATLEPGDLIFTGTPPGVGDARKPPVYLKPGDEVEVEIQGLGVLANPVVAQEQ